jgi:hypothetical protein
VDAAITDGSANAVAGNAVFDALSIKANLASPTFTGTVTATTLQAGSTTGIDLKDHYGNSVLRVGVDHPSTGWSNGVAIGDGAIASGSNAYAHGEGALASGNLSHAEGLASVSSGYNSHAAGTKAKATHWGSRVMTDGQNAECASTATDQCTLRYQNGYRFLGGAADFAVAPTVSGVPLGSPTTAAILTALGLATHANLTAANAALAIGSVYYDTALGKIHITTA